MELGFETRMLIDGELVEAQGGRTYDNLNPATETVIGPVADAAPADMERAIAAARRAFDTTTWSTDRAFRKACLQQLKEALDKHKEELRPQIVAEAQHLLLPGNGSERAVEVHVGDEKVEGVGSEVERGDAHRT